MHQELLEAVKSAGSPEHVTRAMEAAIEAAYVSGRQFGYAAAIEALARPYSEPAPEPTVDEEPTQVYP